MTTKAAIAAKQYLRATVRATLSGVSEESIAQQSKTLFDTITKYPPYVQATSISIFLSMPTGEIQTADIVRHALDQGKKVYIPYLHGRPAHLTTVPKRVMDMVRLKDIDDYLALKPDKWGIPSIHEDSVISRERVLGETEDPVDLANLDLVLVPGLAFERADEGVRRIGHGRGFYDVFFERYAVGRKIPKLVGLGLKEQLLIGGIVVGPQDIRLDSIALGDGQIFEHPAIHRKM